MSVRYIMLNTKSQTGATLFVGLILLVAISIISLAAMRTSLLDLAITNNKQQFTNTFEASEQVVNTRLTNMQLAITGTQTTGDIIPGSNQTIAVTTLNTAGANVTVADVNSDVTYRTLGTGTGWALNGSAYHFQLNVRAVAPGRGANSNHRVGFFIVAPSAGI